MSHDQAQKAAERILAQSSLRPSLALVLGSGFQAVLEHIDPVAEILYREVPGFPKLHVPGHQGRILVAKRHDVALYILSGRAHYYEGHSMETVTFPVRALAACGIKSIFLTNAAGGINRRFRTGDLMLVTDHINGMGINPLRSESTAQAPKFVDLTQVYDSQLGSLLKKAARLAGLRLRSGVYFAVAGPSFETPAEIRALERLGADAVGMSTVPEAVVARSFGLKVLALSCITNFAAGRNSKPISHDEVIAMGKQAHEKTGRLISEFLKEYGRIPA